MVQYHLFRRTRKKFLFPVHPPGENLFCRQLGANFFSYTIVRLAMIFCLLFTFLHVSFFLKRSIRSNNSSIDSRWVYCVTFFINRMFTFFVVHFGVRFTGTLVVSVTIFWFYSENLFSTCWKKIKYCFLLYQSHKNKIDER